MQRALALLFAVAALICGGVSLFFFGRAAGPGELRMYGLAFLFVTAGLAFVGLVLFSAPIRLRRDSSFGSLGIAVLFLGVAVVIKACGK